MNLSAIIPKDVRVAPLQACFMLGVVNTYRHNQIDCRKWYTARRAVLRPTALREDLSNIETPGGSAQGAAWLLWGFL